MNWEAIGATGEIVGAAAVVLTLAYLAVQIRTARIASAQGATYSTVEAYSRWRQSFLQNSDVARAVAKANRGEALDDEDSVILTALMDELFIVSSISTISTDEWNSIQAKTVDLEYLDGILRANPGLLSHWWRFRSVVALISEEYAEIVDAMVREIEAS